MNHPEVTERYCPLLKPMQLTSRACKSPLTLTTAVKNESIHAWCAFFLSYGNLAVKVMRRSNRTELYKK